MRCAVRAACHTEGTPEEVAVRMFRWLYRNYEMAAYGFVVMVALALAALLPITLHH